MRCRYPGGSRMLSGSAQHGALLRVSASVDTEADIPLVAEADGQDVDL